MEPLILHADHLLTMDAANTIVSDAALLVGADGRIADVGTAAELFPRNTGVPVRRLKNRLLMPGLVNTHSHSGLLRGTAEGLPVWDWLQQYIDPMHRVVSPEDAEIASRLCYAESLLAGTTTIVDMWRHMEGSARAARDLGIRAVLVPYVAEHPDHDYFETLDTNEALIERWHGGADGRIQVWVGMEHMFYATPPAWRRAIEISQRHGTGFHTHSNESRFDVEETLRRHNMRPIEALESFGLLDAPRTLLAHCVWLSEAEIAILARRGIAVAHNPVSNMKLASGAAPVEALLAAGINVGLGTDGEKENNNLDMFEEMKFASLLQKVSTLDPTVGDPWDVLAMATLDGARALGLAELTGSLEVGKRADVVTVDLRRLHFVPVFPAEHFNIAAHLVFAASGRDVDSVWVDGRRLVDGGTLLTVDEAKVIADSQLAAEELFERRRIEFGH
jgi:5-methylthioadenosine/S-adenosylhomocysteine deaminase